MSRTDTGNSDLSVEVSNQVVRIKEATPQTGNSEQAPTASTVAEPALDVPVNLSSAARAILQRSIMRNRLIAGIALLITLVPGIQFYFQFGWGRYSSLAILCIDSLSPLLFTFVLQCQRKAALRLLGDGFLACRLFGQAMCLPFNIAFDFGILMVGSAEDSKYSDPLLFQIFLCLFSWLGMVCLFRVVRWELRDASMALPNPQFGRPPENYSSSRLGFRVLAWLAWILAPIMTLCINVHWEIEYFGLKQNSPGWLYFLKSVVIPGVFALTLIFVGVLHFFSRRPTLRLMTYGGFIVCSTSIIWPALFNIVTGLLNVNNSWNLPYAPDSRHPWYYVLNLAVVLMLWWVIRQAFDRIQNDFFFVTGQLRSPTQEPEEDLGDGGWDDGGKAR